MKGLTENVAHMPKIIGGAAVAISPGASTLWGKKIARENLTPDPSPPAISLAVLPCQARCGARNPGGEGRSSTACVCADKQSRSASTHRAGERKAQKEFQSNHSRSPKKPASPHLRSPAISVPISGCTLSPGIWGWGRKFLREENSSAAERRHLDIGEPDVEMSAFSSGDFGDELVA